MLKTGSLTPTSRKSAVWSSSNIEHGIDLAAQSRITGQSFKSTSHSWISHVNLDWDFRLIVDVRMVQRDEPTCTDASQVNARSVNHMDCRIPLIV